MENENSYEARVLVTQMNLKKSIQNFMEAKLEGCKDFDGQEGDDKIYQYLWPGFTCMIKAALSEAIKSRGKL